MGLQNVRSHTTMLCPSVFPDSNSIFWSNLTKSHLFPKWACPKNPDMSISAKKVAGGPVAETARSCSEETPSENLPPRNQFIFLITWKSRFFKKNAVIDWNLQVKVNFYWKPKWSLWSIWTYSTGRISRFVTRKWVLDENYKNCLPKKMKIRFWDLKLTFWDWIWVRNDF